MTLPPQEKSKDHLSRQAFQRFSQCPNLPWSLNQSPRHWQCQAPSCYQFSPDVRLICSSERQGQPRIDICLEVDIYVHGWGNYVGPKAALLTFKRTHICYLSGKPGIIAEKSQLPTGHLVVPPFRQGPREEGTNGWETRARKRPSQPKRVNRHPGVSDIPNNGDKSLIVMIWIDQFSSTH